MIAILTRLSLQSGVVIATLGGQWRMMVGRHRLFLALLLGLIGSPTFAASPPIIVGQTYEAARHRLQNLGYHPVDLRSAKKQECILGKEAICKRYIEMESCAVDGLGQCRFLWLNRKGVEFLVTTSGETLPDLTVFDVRYQFKK